MVFKNFRLQIVIRVLLLTIGLSTLAWCIANGFYLRSYYVGFAALILLVELVWYIDRFNRDINTFMNSLLQRDFTTHYQVTGKGKNFDALYEIFNRISEAFKKISVEKEIQHRYLELLVDHVQVGILSYDSGEKIHLANTAIKKLLQRHILKRLDTLDSIDEGLAASVRKLKAGETKLVKTRIGKELLQLSIHASEFKLNDEYFKLVSMQNIHNELDAREMEAWQKLIRVMTHEIMNSIAPITSLSATLHGLVKQNQHALESIDVTTFNTLDQGLDAIKSRSEGLHYFTEAYRRLTRIPTPSFRNASLKEVIQRVVVLLKQDIDEKHVDLQLHLTGFEMLIDPELMEQVIINLVRNALQAVEDSSSPSIRITTIQHPHGKVIFQITDNGVGISPEMMENIFIPFFTTKKNGSGIGLALAKQIVQLHHGEIKVVSSQGNGAEFTISI